MNTLCWLRRDLRLHDNAALSYALQMGETHLCFVFDPHILGPLKNKKDQRVTFIYDSLKEIEVQLRSQGSSLHILYGKPEEEIPRLAEKLKVHQTVCNRDYEPYAKKREAKVERKLKSLGIAFEQFKDQVIFEKHEILTNSGGPYKVYTPYKNKWLALFEKQERILPEHKCYLKNLVLFKNTKNILAHDWYKAIGFLESPPSVPAGTGAALARLKVFKGKIDDYKEVRNYPALEGVSGLSPYLRFGNLSIRDMVRVASCPTWLSEIIWREFYVMILDAYPQVIEGPYRPEYAKIKWLGEKKHFKLWCEGRTGFPIVDAAMRCLNKSGLMHNRLRMITASFLCKTLLLDWRKGEHYFAEKLLDFDLANNNGGWQWCAGSGTDAQPYFRIFNPFAQSEKYDPKEEFIRQWCPELKLVQPIVNYQANRIRCLTMYSAVKD